MTALYALDLTQDRAALHLWDADAWSAVAQACAPSGDPARDLSDLLRPVAGANIIVALPEDEIVRLTLPVGANIAEALADVPGEGPWRADCAFDAGQQSVAAVPEHILDQAQAFLTALGVRLAGGLAAAPGGGGMDAAAWFGGPDSPTDGVRALDRPESLGPDRAPPQAARRDIDPPVLAEPHTAREVTEDAAPASASAQGAQTVAPPAPPAPAPLSRDQEDAIAAARLVATRIAARDPAHTIPLRDPPEDSPDPKLRQRGARGLPKRAARAAAVVMVLGIAAFGVSRIGVSTQAPVVTAPPADLAAAPLASPAPDAAAPQAAPQRGAQAPAVQPLPALQDAAPAPARPVTADIRATDGPAGLGQAATFYTPPPVIGTTFDAAARRDVGALTFPGLDPVFRTDALALAQTRAPGDAGFVLAALLPPGPPGEVYVVDENGLIRPSPEGRLSPDGFRVVAGPPPAVTRPRPDRTEAETVRVLRRADLPEDDPLRNLSPRGRPDSLVERFERDRLGGRTETELAVFSPVLRPASAQADQAATATPPTAQAVATSPRPTARSAETRARFAAKAAATPIAPIATADVQTVRSASPEAARDHATRGGRLNLSEVNLLGTFGGSRDRRALVRLPSGRVINVSVGDRVDGGRVAGIRDGQLSYVKSGRTVTLNMPRG